MGSDYSFFSFSPSSPFLYFSTSSPSSTSSSFTSSSPSSSLTSLKETIEQQIKENPVLMYSATYCGYCVKAMTLFNTMKVKPYVVYLDKDPQGEEISILLYSMTGQETVPNIFIGGKHIGGFSQLLIGLKNRSVQSELRRIGIKFEDFGS